MCQRYDSMDASKQRWSEIWPKTQPHSRQDGTDLLDVDEVRKRQTKKKSEERVEEGRFFLQLCAEEYS